MTLVFPALVMIDIDVLSKAYFWFDIPVPYQLADNKEILIYPISVKDSEMFLTWVDIISVDKNSLPDPKYISMPYLNFLINTFILAEDKTVAESTQKKLSLIFRYCLKLENDISIILNEKKKLQLICGDYTIGAKQFDDIRRIILYQNILGYDDSYIDPDVQQVIQEMEELKSKDIDFPTMERKMAIITAHTGITKEAQMAMTFRSHTSLFKEVCGEVDFSTIRTAALIGNMFSEKKNELEDWIYKKKRGKYDGYFVNRDDYTKSMGENSMVRSVDKVQIDIDSLNI